MTTFGCDLASYQAGLDLSELTGLDFVFAKVTEGDYYVDPDYAGWHAAAGPAGKTFVWYHFLKAEISAQAQAAYTKANVGDASLPGMLDVETEGASKPSLAEILGYIDAAAALGLRVKLVYLPEWYWSGVLGSPDLSPLAARGVAVVSSAYPRSASAGAAPTYAEDGGDSGAGWNPYGGQTPLLWQFADDGPAAGQKIDLDAYRGTGEQLAAFLGEPSPTPPKPPVSSDPRVVVLQKELNAAGASPALAEDGQKGPLTKGQWLSVMARTGQIMYGSTGIYVRCLQAMLNTWGSTLAVDGNDGPLTTAEVEHMQGVLAIHVDGQCGPITKAALGR